MRKKLADNNFLTVLDGGENNDQSLGYSGARQSLGHSNSEYNSKKLQLLPGVTAKRGSQKRNNNGLLPPMGPLPATKKILQLIGHITHVTEEKPNEAASLSS